jgi:hypothetical protein
MDHLDCCANSIRATRALSFCEAALKTSLPQRNIFRLVSQTQVARRLPLPPRSSQNGPRGQGIRCAAPNTGSPLTAAGRSGAHPEMRGKVNGGSLAESRPLPSNRSFRHHGERHLEPGRTLDGSGNPEGLRRTDSDAFENGVVRPEPQNHAFGANSRSVLGRRERGRRSCHRKTKERAGKLPGDGAIGAARAKWFDPDLVKAAPHGVPVKTHSLG